MEVWAARSPTILTTTANGARKCLQVLKALALDDRIQLLRSAEDFNDAATQGRLRN